MTDAATFVPQRRMSGRETFVRYVVFAAVASAANLGTQWATARLVPAAPTVLAVLAGTGVGFVIKYLLEKQWVFFDPYTSHRDEARKVMLYGLSGVGTTLLFWAVEFGAWGIWRTEAARLAGGAVGLAVGNWIKYQLDKHVVFRARR